jgi:Zn-dependent peptidase ImmA (M78 family)/DNA-binding XRE family transcriptional regulator
MTGLEQLDPKTLGQRLADARNARGITQEDAAKHLGCSRPTFIAIEKGTRTTTSEEIVKLCALYGRKVNEIVRPGEPLADLQPHLRAVAQQMKADDAELLKAIADLQRFAENYNHLEKILKVPLRLNYPTEVQLGRRVDVSGLAEDEAIKERQRLGLGDQPVIHLRSLLEAEVGLRIIYDDLPSRIAGMFAYSGEFGGVITVNRKHPPERRRATLLHEYGHLITDRYKPGIDYLSYTGRKPSNERFAESFSMAFLMPATSVRRRFNQVVNDSGDFHIADLCRLRHFYFVSLEAMTLRLEGLSLIPKGVRDHLKESRFEVRRASEMLNLQQHPVTNRRFPDRFVFLAVQAFDRGELSEGELASMLQCDRVTARELVDQFLTTTDMSDDGEIRQMQIKSDLSLLRGELATTGRQQRVVTLDE